MKNTTLVTREERIQKGDGKAVRSDRICIRVLTVLERIERDLFIRRAVKLAQAKGLHLWESKTMPIEESAHDSLRILLCEKSSPSTYGVFTGVNSHWVLDIWELACDHFESCALKLVRDEEADEPFRRSTVEAPLLRVAVEHSLSERLMSAYIGRDDTEILRIVKELKSADQ